MPALRVDSLDPRGPDKTDKLWELCGVTKCFPDKIHKKGKMYFLITREEIVEKLLTDEIKNIFKNENLAIKEPLEYEAMRTVVVKRLDRHIDQYTEEEIRDSIQRLNTNIVVESVYRFPNTTSKMMKIKMKSTAMAKQARDQGLIILNQRMPSTAIEKEIFVKLKPC